MTLNSKSYLEKFRDWFKNYQILNPLEYELMIENIFFNIHNDILWINFKSEYDTCLCITQFSTETEFGFYVSKSGSNIRISKCVLKKWIDLNSYIPYSDLSRLNLLHDIGLLEFKMCSENCVLLKFII